MIRLMKKLILLSMLFLLFFCMNMTATAADNISKDPLLQVVPMRSVMTDTINCNTSREVLADNFAVYYGEERWTCEEDYVFSIKKYCQYGISDGKPCYTWTFQVIPLRDEFDSIEVIDVTLPEKITGLQVTPGANKMTLSWTRDKGSFGYIIYRSKNGGTYTKVAEIRNSYTTKWVDTSVSGTTTKYTYKVASLWFNKSRIRQITGKSDPVSGMLLKSPTLKCSNVSSGIKLTWTKSSLADSYQVLRSTTDRTFTKIATISGNSTLSYIDTTAKTGKVYFYRVYAVKNGTKSLKTTSVPYARVKTPTSVKLTKSGTSLKVTFSDANESGTKYQVQMATDKSFTNPVKYTISGKAKTITSLKKGKTYYVRVRAYRGEFIDRVGTMLGVKNVYSGWTSVKSVTM